MLSYMNPLCWEIFLWVVISLEQFWVSLKIGAANSPLVLSEQICCAGTPPGLPASALIGWPWAGCLLQVQYAMAGGLGAQVPSRATCGEKWPRWVSLSRGSEQACVLGADVVGSGTWQSVRRRGFFLSKNRAFKSSVNTAHCASHFPCEKNHRKAQLHLHEKPRKPSYFPQDWFSQKCIWFPVSMLWSRLPFASWISGSQSMKAYHNH